MKFWHGHVIDFMARAPSSAPGSSGASHWHRGTGYPGKNPWVWSLKIHRFRIYMDLYIYIQYIYIYINCLNLMCKSCKCGGPGKREAPIYIYVSLYHDTSNCFIVNVHHLRMFRRCFFLNHVEALMCIFIFRSSEADFGQLLTGIPSRIGTWHSEDETELLVQVVYLPSLKLTGFATEKLTATISKKKAGLSSATIYFPGQTVSFVECTSVSLIAMGEKGQKPVIKG